MKNLTELYSDMGNFLITAHRGASYEFPENTLPAMRKAVEAGADMIEFDLRSSADGVPILLHDETVDRTSDGHGKPEKHTLAELKKMNFSWYHHFKRLPSPFCSMLAIPTFEEVLFELHDKVCMNIQVYTQIPETTKEVCRLYKKYDMYDRGYMTVSPEKAEFIRSVDPDIEFCITPGWAERTAPENLKLCKRLGARFVQPVRETCTPETFIRLRELGLRGNVFFADEPDIMDELRRMGAQGVLTNNCELLCRYRKRFLPKC
ncbi:MAG: glycerophosphodiester phosphodiesterase family protein [Victivallales bacterium]|nr:glycerophosphodiester phosphodiesterase family protein [Victivallales bacterium]